MKFCEDELGINNSLTAHWNRHLRQVVAEALAEEPVQLRGPSRAVELDESLFSRSKYDRGKRYPQQWVFRGTKLATPLLYRWRTGVSHPAADHTEAREAWHHGDYGRVACPLVSQPRGVHAVASKPLSEVCGQSTGARTQSTELLWAQAKWGEQAAVWNASECTSIAPVRVHVEEAFGSIRRRTGCHPRGHPAVAPTQIECIAYVHSSASVNDKQ
ncbi:hypothetical protein M514_25708 [Trichuris suis]|uniref:Uncharacterized protein n=1 Tax=Trichuris suis TaxID=68888 RepID=A0A085MY10_9BILA|nr:hypothetical protein M514_25708 [Trichuris suis]